MKAIRRLMILGVLAMLATAFPVPAQGPPDMPPPPGMRGGPPMGPPDPVIGMAGRALHDLELDREQRDQIREIVRGSMEGELGQQVMAFHDARRDLELVVWDSSATEQDLITAGEVLSAAAEQLELLRHQLALDVLDVLTEEQREAFYRMLEAEPQNPGEPGGQGGPGGLEGRSGPGPRRR